MGGYHPISWGSIQNKREGKWSMLLFWNLHKLLFPRTSNLRFFSSWPPEFVPEFFPTSLASQIFGLKCDYIAGFLRMEVLGQNQSSSTETDIRDYWAPWRHDSISYHSHLYYPLSYLSITYLPVIGLFLFIIPSINYLWIILTTSEWCSLNACS